MGGTDADGDADLEALLDLATPWVLRVVATLGIVERIGEGVDRVEDLAGATGCDRDALGALLGHAAAVGVFTQPGPGRFGLTAAAVALGQQARFLDLDGIGGRFADAWGTLLAYVRTGRPAYAERFGLPFWDDLDAHPTLGAEFDALMGPEGHGQPDADIELTGGWAGVAHVVDVGGGTGAMLAAVLRRHRHVRGTLVERSGAVAGSDSVFAEAGVADRVEAVAQSFFDPLPPGADVYLLCKVLNDWPEPETVAILTRCAEAARPTGRVVVIGGVSAEGGSRRLQPEAVLVGGTTNSLEQFRGVAGQAGLTVVASRRQASGRAAVECHPV
jgi:hypothetical protein